MAMSDQFRVLLMDRDDLGRADVRRALVVGERVDLHEASDGAAAVARLTFERFDCAVLGMRLDDPSELDVLRHVRAAGVNTPILLLSPSNDRDRAVEMMKAGASDYLVRGEFSPEHLSDRVRAIAQMYRSEANASRAAAELKESEDRFRATADAAPILLWVTDGQGRCTYLNQQWLAFTGRPLEAQLGLGWQEAVHPGDVAKVADICAEHYRLRTPFQIEYRLRRKDGEYRWVLSNAAPRLLPDGTLMGFIGTCVDVTEQRRTEEALREANQALAAVINASPLAIYTLDAAGVVKSWNPAAEKMFGYSSAEAVGRPLLPVPPEASGEFADSCRRVLAGERLSNVEAVRRRRDGSAIHVSLSYAPLSDAGGRNAGVLVIATDITDRKRAEEERAQLLERERSARSAAEAAQRRLAFVAAASELLSSSLEYEATLTSVARLVVPQLASWCAVDVINREGLLSRLAVAHVDSTKLEQASDLQRKYPADPESSRGVHHVVRTGKAQLFSRIGDEMLVSTARDEEHLSLLRELNIKSAMIVPLLARGRTFGAITFISCDESRLYGAEDLTLAEDLGRRAAAAVDNALLYREATQNLAEKQKTAALLETLLRTAPVGMAFFDTDFRFVRVNACMAEMDGVSRQEHVGRTVVELLPETWKAWEPMFRQVRDTGEPVTDVEITGQTPAAPGFVQSWLCSFYPVEATGAEAAGIGVVVVDITDRKRWEQELTEAKESAEMANRSKDQFLAVLSHELRTPLTPVLAEVTSLQSEQGLNSDIRTGLQVIRRNVELEARLIDDLLDLTRIAKGKLRLNLEPVDVHEALASALEICRTDALEKNLSLKTEWNAERPWVRADAARLRQVLWNLIKNAVKFTQPGGSIRIRTQNDGDRLRIEVSDSGIGIDADVLPRIFFAFEQAEQSITRRFGGLGLGLAISKSLVDMHGGRLAAASPGKNQGATFTVELATTARPVAKAPGAAEPPAPRPQRAVRILMVDDHPDTGRAMQRLLEKIGYRVQLAESVASAVAAASAEPFDLLISDIGLPDGDGCELLRTLAAQRPVKAIALSGFGMEDDVRRSRAAGFAEHLTKPVNFDKLEALIGQLLENDAPAVHAAEEPAGS